MLNTKPYRPPIALDQTTNLMPTWFKVGLVAVVMTAIALRFWGLGRFNTLVFDEAYFVRLAIDYLQGTPGFEGHPPLSSYLTALGLRLGQLWPADPTQMNGYTGTFLSPVSYRWLNALTGSLIPLIMAGIAVQLSRRWSYGLMAAVLATADGLLLVESRYALINIYMLLFGLAGHFFLLLGLNRQRWRWGWFSLAGICCGAAIAIKWNGSGFLLGIYGIWGIAWLIAWMARISGQRAIAPTAPTTTTPLHRLTQIRPGQFIWAFAILPALTYRLSWAPYLRLSPGTSFWQWQARILDYHHRVGGMDVHPYCSPWYSWPLLWRPVAYFYETARNADTTVPVIGPHLPPDLEAVIYDVHAMGNPALWWLSTAALLVILVTLAQRGWRWLRQWQQSASQPNPASLQPPLRLRHTTWIALYLTVAWAANWLPWVAISRCTFIYHYMGSATFAVLAIAWLIARWSSSQQSWQRITSGTTFLLIVLAFGFWLPIYLGLPLSPMGLQLRLWFHSWI